VGILVVSKSSSRALRILIMVNIGYEAGGAEKSVQLTRDAMRARGHDVLVVSTDFKLGDRKPFADVIVPRRPGGTVSSLLSRFWKQDVYQALKATINEFSPDVIHAHTIGEFGSAALWATGEVPTVLTVHGPEPYTRRLLLWMLPGIYYRRSSYRLRDLKPIGVVYYLFLLFLQRPIYRRGFRYVDMIVTPSIYLARALDADAGRIPVTQVYNGMVFPPAPPFRRTRNVLFVGRLEAVKGVDILLRAAALACEQVHGLSVTIAGDGEDRSRLERMSSDLGLDGIVQFRGWLTLEEVAACYADAEIVAIPSIWPETLPSVGIEALAAGRPVVASDVGGIPEIVVDGVTGRLVRRRDARLLADALVDILTSAETAEQMSLSARLSVAKFDMETFGDRIESIYQMLVRKAEIRDLERFAIARASVNRND
jgi:glycosyltransferase involved in cell wall biosynthesis